MAIALASAVVAGAVVGARSLGTLEGLELAAYDWFLRLRPEGGAADSRIVLVVGTEQDIRAHGGWPLSDAVLADVLQRLARSGARAIGLDIYRDLPVPPGTERLNEVFTSDARIIAITQFGARASDGVPPPPALRDTNRVGFSDILVDPGGIVRRGLLYLDDGQRSVPSFALVVALLYLQAEGIAPRPDPQDPTHLRLGRATIRPLEANDGPYVRADARGYQVLLDFKGGMNAFTPVTIGDVLAGVVPAGTFRDKIALVGVAAESVQDHFNTPFSRGRDPNQHMAGLAVHAHAVSQLLRTGLDGASSLRFFGAGLESVWILLWSALGGLLGFRLRSPWRLSSAFAGAIAGLAVIDIGLFVTRWWLPLVPPAMALLGSAALATAVTSYRQALERAALMRLFSIHVSKEFAATIWEQRDEFRDGHRPRSRRLIATAMFADLAGFTRVAEALPPDAVMDWLNEYMDAMAREVARHGGVVRQYAGDSIIAFFGMPFPRATEAEIARDATNAVICALGMRAALRGLNDRWRIEGRPTIGMRIGIYTGPVVTGNLGSAERSEYVVVGDAVNTASRLESFDKARFAPDPAGNPCRILVGDSTLHYLGDHFELHCIGEFILGGKARPVTIYRVTDSLRANAARTQGMR